MEMVATGNGRTVSGAATAYPGIGWREVTQWLGITARQLETLKSTGLVNPQCLGHKLIWSLRQAYLVGVATELRRRHCNGKKLKKAIQVIAREIQMPAYLIVTRSGEARVARNEFEAIAIATREKEPVSLVDTHRIHARLRVLATYLEKTV